MPLEECTDLAVNYISEGNSNINITLYRCPDWQQWPQSLCNQCLQQENFLTNYFSFTPYLLQIGFP